MLPEEFPPALERHLLRFLREMAETRTPSNYEDDKSGFLFHMGDMADDIVDLAALYQNSAEIDFSTAEVTLQSFFFHAIPHIIAAAEIYDEYPEMWNMLRKKRDGES